MAVVIPSDVISGAHTYSCRVDSWLGSTWLGRVPVAGGSVSWDASQQVTGALSLTVPQVAAPEEGADVRDWTPTSVLSPLACAGQVLHVSVTVGSTITPDTWTVPVGRFLITEWQAESHTIRVTGKSTMHRLEEDRLTSPTVPRSGGTLASELRRLVAGHMGVLVDPTLRDRACPSMSWGESRVDAVYEIADAWPARLREGGDGILRVLPPTPSGTARTLTDGVGGTVIAAPRQASRDQVYNRVVARGQDQDDSGTPMFQAVADQTTGPLAVGGPYGVVTRFFSSPLITSQAAATSAARSLLATSVLRSQTVPVTCVPDPTLCLDDTVTLVTRDADRTAPTRRSGVVSAVELPLTHEGTMRVDVEVTG